MAHAVIVKSQTLSSNADSHMRNAVAAIDLDNGSLMRLNSQKADCDNMSPKFIIDGLVESGFIIDDDYKHMHSLTLRVGYDKEHPRTEMLIHIY